MLGQRGISTRFLVAASAFLILMAPLFAIVPAQKAYAATKTWDGGGTEDFSHWFDCGNWSGDTCPTGHDNIVIGPGYSVWGENFLLESDGTLTVAAGSGFSFFGLTNHGTIYLFGSTGTANEEPGIANHGTIFIDGTITNEGELTNGAGGLIQINAGGTLINDAPGDIHNDGTIVKKCGGTYTETSAELHGNPIVEESCGESSCDNPTITGTNSNDVIDGTPGADVIHAKGGDDKINGLGGNDIICGGSGNDTINGGAGSDIIFGGHGNDSISGGKGNDTLNGGAGSDSISGNGGNDDLIGSSGNDTLSGIDGTANNDSLDGGFGTDTCNGNPDPEVNCEV
jgi:Ca2+-binding RTX toxin-like protein